MSKKEDVDKEAEIIFPDAVVSVERALRIIELLTESESGMTLTEVAMVLAVNKAIASKLLQTLEKCEYIFRHGNNFLLTIKSTISASASSINNGCWNRRRRR